jgi:hypothetical protein
VKSLAEQHKEGDQEVKLMTKELEEQEPQDSNYGERTELLCELLHSPL